MMHTPVVQALVGRVNDDPGWKHAFSKAVADAIDQAPTYMEKYGIQDLEGYFNYMDALQNWVPSENSTATQVLERVRIFYFLFNQTSVRGLQTPLKPEATRGPISWLSGWLVRYARSLGHFLDTPESLTAETLATFRASGKYELDDYLVPDGGWKSFNHFFARRVKPNKRPIAAPADPMVIVSPADSMLQGTWPVDKNGSVTFKGIPWRISDLLQDSAYGECFCSGVFLHSILFPFDYHRMHAPVGGKVLECRVIPAQVMLEAIAVNGRPRSNPNAEEGYQWCQTRGLVVLDSPIGKVAILPIGMGHISSVTMTPRVGEEIAKGDEIGYFQFGGSDIIVVFESISNITIPASDDRDHPDARYKMGEKLGVASLCN
jgi:phosphatidylserine decarboxylase precursor